MHKLQTMHLNRDKLEYSLDCSLLMTMMACTMKQMMKKKHCKKH
jgi:hypothetical protein